MLRRRSLQPPPPPPVEATAGYTAAAGADHLVAGLELLVGCAMLIGLPVADLILLCSLASSWRSSQVAPATVGGPVATPPLRALSTTPPPVVEVRRAELVPVTIRRAEFMHPARVSAWATPQPEQPVYREWMPEAGGWVLADAQCVPIRGTFLADPAPRAELVSTSVCEQ